MILLDMDRRLVAHRDVRRRRCRPRQDHVVSLRQDRLCNQNPKEVYLKIDHFPDEIKRKQSINDFVIEY